MAAEEDGPVDTSILPYDIVEMVASDEALNGGLAYVTRIPPGKGGGRTYHLWYPGDPDSDDIEISRPRGLTYQVGSEESMVSSITLRSRPEDPSIQRAIRAEKGRYILGVPRDDFTQRHPLRVIRTDPTGIYVVRQGDLAETVIQIPVDSYGIGNASPYVFLMPSESRAVDDEDLPSIPSTAERDNEIRRLQESSHVRVIRTDLPEYIVRDETIREGGTRDTERFRGQVVAVIGSIRGGDGIEHIAASERIKDLVLRETRESIGGREPVFREEDPVLLRKGESGYPHWMIPIDGGRKEEIIKAAVKPADSPGDLPKIVPVTPAEISRDVMRLPLRENITRLREPYALLPGEGTEVSSPTPYILSRGIPIVSYKALAETTSVEGGVVVSRIATPATQIMMGGGEEDSMIVIPGERIQPDGGVVIPVKGYAAPSIPLVEAMNGVGWSRSLSRHTPLSTAPVLIRPPEDASLLLDTPVVLDKTLITSEEAAREVLSLPLRSVIETLEDVTSAGQDEIAERTHAFGYTRDVITHREAALLSQICDETSRRTQTLRDDIAGDEKIIRIPRPDALFQDKRDLRAAYPETNGLIGPWEAFHRISMAPGDYGDLLYIVRSINEYSGIREFLVRAAEEAQGRRSGVRDEMARVQEKLQEIEGQLRTLDNIAKHYESRQEVDADNKAAKEGKIILWDESKDTDPMRSLYSGDRLRKITGALLLKLQEEGSLPLDAVGGVGVTARAGVLATGGTIAARDGEGDEAAEVCPTGGRTSFGDIDPDLLLRAVRDDIEGYNASLPSDRQMNDARKEEIVRRVILGGRPVADGDVALITRHLRTAAYTWSADKNRWVAVKGETLKSTQEDLNLSKVGRSSGDEDAPAELPPRARTVYERTLALNREYRVLSKRKDDLELAQSKPSITMNPEEMTRALDVLFRKGDPVFQRRRRCVKNNRVMDETPFVYDMLDILLRRRVEYQASREDQRGDVGQGSGLATAADLRRAILRDDELVVDIERAQYETGYGAYESGATEDIEIERSHPVGGVPDTAITDDPRVIEVSRRRETGQGGVRFMMEVRARSDKLRRAVLLGAGLMETTLRVSLSPEEVGGLVTEADVLVEGVKGNSPDAILTGSLFAALLLMTRLDSVVTLPTSEGIVPPPARSTLPSYFYPPARGGDDERMIRFFYEIIRKIASTVSTTSHTSGLSKSRTPIELLSESVVVKKKDSEGYREMERMMSRIARSSPVIVDRAFRAQHAADLPRSYGEIMANRALRRTGMWEDIPVGYRPSPGGRPITDGRRVLVDESPLLTNSTGIPLRENAALASPVSDPTLRTVLEAMGRERAEALIRVLYRTAERERSSRQRGPKTVLYSPAYDFIGVKRERIPETPLTIPEATLAIASSVPVALQDTPVMADILGPEPEGSEEAAAARGLREHVERIMEGVVEASQLNRPTGDEAENATRTFMRFGEGKATLDSGDANGSLRAELLSVHDALLIAVEDHLRDMKGIPRLNQEPENGGSYARFEGPLYGIHNRVKHLMSGVSPERIETGSGGGRMAVLVGDNTYYERVKTVYRLLSDALGINTIERHIALRILLRDIRTTTQSMPDRIPRALILRKIIDVLYERAQLNADAFASVDAYVALFAHRYQRGRGAYEDFGVIDELRKMASDYTDVSPSMITEEANKDREMERQRFIYRLEGLDTERRKITRAIQKLGLDLAGKVAADPKKFNAEYYTQQSELVADQEMRRDDRADIEGVSPEDAERIREFGDPADAAFMEAAANEAPAEADQVEDVDYDT